MTSDRISPSDTQYATKPTRIQVAVWILLVIVTLSVSLGNYEAYQFGVHYDDARYTVLARSLVFSDKYGMMNFPGEPETGKYPFGYPLLLVPFVLFPLDNFDSLKVLSLISTILNASILFMGWRSFVKTLSYWWAIAVIGLYLLAPMTIDLTRRVMSEPIFTTFCLLALWLAEQAVHGKPSRWWSLQMSTALMFALFTRTIGVALIGAVFLYLLFRGSRKLWKQIALIVAQMIVLVGVVIAATPVELADLWPSEYLKDPNASLVVAPLGNTIAPEPAPPLTDIGELLTYKITQNLGIQVRMVALPIGGGAREQSFADRMGMPVLPLILAFIVSGFVYLGLGRLLVQERLPVFSLFGVFYLGTIFFWWWNDPRLLYPIVPQILTGLLIGLETLFLWPTSTIIRRESLLRSLKLTLTFLVLILMVISLYASLRIDDSRLHAGDLRVRTAWLKSNSALSEIIMTEAPETDYLYSGRKTIPYPLRFSSSLDIEAYLSETGIDYILVAPQIEWQQTYQPHYSDAVKGMLPLLSDLSAKNRIKSVYVSEKELVQVFKVVR